LLESIKKELSLVILKLHLVDLLFRGVPPTPLPYYWYGYERAFSGHSSAKSGHLRAKSSTLTNNPRDQETEASFSANVNKVYVIQHLAMLLIQVSQF